VYTHMIVHADDRMFHLSSFILFIYFVPSFLPNFLFSLLIILLHFLLLYLLLFFFFFLPTGPHSGSEWIQQESLYDRCH
jgi:hypothetical protein